MSIYALIQRMKKSFVLICLSIVSITYGQELPKNDGPEDSKVQFELTTQQEPNIENTTPDIIIDEDEFEHEQSLPTTIHNSDEDELDSDASQEPKEPTNAQEAEQCEKFLKEVLNNFKKIDINLEYIALVINNNQIRLSDSEPLLEEVMQLRSLVHMVTGSAFTAIKKEQLAHLLDLAQKLTNHIRAILKTDLIHFTPFNMAASAPSRTTPSLAKTTTFDQLEAQLKQNNGLLTQLESEAENVGLNIYNRIFRRLEKLDNDYKIVNKCMWGLVIGAGVLWTAYCINSYYHKQIAAFCTKMLGHCGFTQLPQSPIENDPYNIDIKPSSRQLPSLGSKPLEESGPVARDSKDAPWWKKLIGDKAIDKEMPEEIMEGMGKNVGVFTRLHILLERELGFIDFKIPAFPLYTLFAPTILELGKNGKELAQSKLSQLASFLRGGPAKKTLGQWERDVKITFDDIIGNEHAKMVLGRIKAYIVDHELFDRGGMAPSNAILLVGKTRTGKTHMVDALVGEIRRELQAKGDASKLTYWYLNAALLKEIGVSNVLLTARLHAPIILFIDEIDKGRFQNDGDANALCELQVAMSLLNIDISKKVIVIAATNNPQLIDPSIRADGRFGERIPFTVPNFEERKEYITRELAKRAAIIDEYYIEKLAHESENANYDGLKGIIVTAFQKAKIKGVALTWEELDEAINEQFHKIIFDEKSLPDKEQYLIAGHQAAHALTRLLLNPSLELTKVTIRPISPNVEEAAVYAQYFASKKNSTNIIEYGNVFTAHKAHASQFQTYNDLVSELTISLAGHAAEKILFGSTSYSYHASDKEDALHIAKLITFGGMQEKDMPKGVKEHMLVDAYELVKKHEKIATDLLEEHKEELTILTNILFEHKILAADEIEHILELIKEKKLDKPSSDTTDDGEDEN